MANLKNMAYNDVSEIQSLGIQVPMEFVLKNVYKFTKKQIQEFKEQQLEDAGQRNKLVIMESKGPGIIQLLNDANNIIPITKYGDYTGNSP